MLGCVQRALCDRCNPGGFGGRAMRSSNPGGVVVLLIGMTLFLGGCAYVSADPIEPGSVTSGIPIPQVKPLLVVGATVQVILVPNTNKQYAMRFGSFLAKHDLTIDLQQGMLQSIVSNQDSTAVPVAFFAALGQAAASGHNLLGGAFAAQASGGGGRLQIYDIIFDDDGNLVGLRPLIRKQDLIAVPAAIGITVPQPQTVGVGNGSPNPPAAAPVKPLPSTGDAAPVKPLPAPQNPAPKTANCNTTPKPHGCS